MLSSYDYNTASAASFQNSEDDESDVMSLESRPRDDATPFAAFEETACFKPLA